MLCILKVIERLSNSLMLITGLQFAGSRATFSLQVQYTYSGRGVHCAIYSVMLCMSR